MKLKTEWDLIVDNAEVLAYNHHIGNHMQSFLTGKEMEEKMADGIYLVKRGGFWYIEVNQILIIDENSSFYRHSDKAIVKGICTVFIEKVKDYANLR